MMRISNLIDTVIGLLDKFQHFQEDVERKAERKLRQIKRRLLRGILQGVLYFSGAILLLIGVILFLTRYFPADFVLIGIGLIIVYIAILIKTTKKN